MKMAAPAYGIVLDGMIEGVKRSYERFAAQPVDWDLSAEPPDPPEALQSTIARPVTVTGPGTFFGRAERTLVFEPSQEQG